MQKCEKDAHECAAASTELASFREHLKTLGGLVGVDAKAGCASLVDAVKAKLERLSTLETQDKERKDAYALETALLDLDKTLGEDGDFEDEEAALKDKQVGKLARELSELPWTALRRVRSVVDRAREAAHPGANGGRDGNLARHNGGDGEDLGVATLAKVWPKKKEEAK